MAVEKGVIMIHGTSSCGSTLLGLLLDGHPEITNLGEWVNFCIEYLAERWGRETWLGLWQNMELFRASPFYETNRPFCTFCGPSCPIIPSRADAVPDLLLHEHYASLRRHLFPAARWFCDTSKNYWYFGRMIRETPRERRVHVLLHKTPWGFVNSRFKQGPAPTEAQVREALQQWTKAHEAVFDIVPPSDPLLIVRYEDLATTPEIVVNRILSTCGLRPMDREEILRYEERPHHQIGGSVSTHAYLASRNRIREGSPRLDPEMVRRGHFIKGIALDPKAIDSRGPAVAMARRMPGLVAIMHRLGRTWPPSKPKGLNREGAADTRFPGHLEHAAAKTETSRK